MTSFRTKPFGLAILALVLVVTRAARAEDDDEPFRESVIMCEEALSKLTECCPQFDPSRVLCNYNHSGTGCTSTSTNEDPALSESESQCIRSRPCDELRLKKVCERAQEAKPYVTRTSYTDGGARDAGSQTHAPVCP